MNEAAGGTTPRDKRNLKRYVGLMFLWAVVYVGSNFVLRGAYVEPVPLRWLIALMPSIFGAIAVSAYWRYLREADELMRAIELKALALAVSVGFIVLPAVELIKAGVPLEFDLNVTMLVMAGFYSFGVVKGRKDYL
jgi:hypothetical protein